jgi:hypothetical protein
MILQTKDLILLRTKPRHSIFYTVSNQIDQQVEDKVLVNLTRNIKPLVEHQIYEKIKMRCLIIFKKI